MSSPHLLYLLAAKMRSFLKVLSKIKIFVFYSCRLKWPTKGKNDVGKVLTENNWRSLIYTSTLEVVKIVRIYSNYKLLSLFSFFLTYLGRLWLGATFSTWWSTPLPRPRWTRTPAGRPTARDSGTTPGSASGSWTPPPSFWQQKSLSLSQSSSRRRSESLQGQYAN